MIGYIYLTTNLINNKMYIGKHESPVYDQQYLGSGKLLIKAVSKYGKKNFTNEVLYCADTIDELNEKEKFYIQEYRQKYPEQMYNIANGGDGGNTRYGMSDAEKELFVKKMTIINKERCNTKEFKEKLSKATSERYKNTEEREIQSKKIRKAWSDQELRREQSERVKKHHEMGLHDYSYMNKPCVFEQNGKKIEFNSLKELLHFLDTNYDYRPGRRKLKQLMEDGKNKIPFSHCHKNRYKNLFGMLIYYK